MTLAMDLTGVWAADDGATYYIRQLSDGSLAWAGLHNSGFHGGMEFTNVFRGRIASDGKTLSGDWADVPRGESNIPLPADPSLAGDDRWRLHTHPGRRAAHHLLPQHLEVFLVEWFVRLANDYTYDALYRPWTDRPANDDGYCPGWPSGERAPDQATTRQLRL